MKKLDLKLGGVKEMLTKEQMKKVVGGDDDYGGSGVRCVFYCCDAFGCGQGVSVDHECSTNEECQAASGVSCPEPYYVAALCKS